MPKSRKFPSLKKKKRRGYLNLVKYREKMRLLKSQKNATETTSELIASECKVLDNAIKTEAATLPDKFQNVDLDCSETMPSSPKTSITHDEATCEIDIQEFVSIKSEPLGADSEELSNFESEHNAIDIKTEPIPPVKLTGTRIVDINHFLSSIAAITVHPGFNCTFADMYPISESWTGSVTMITFKCKMCNLVESISSEKYDLSY